MAHFRPLSRYLECGKGASSGTLLPTERNRTVKEAGSNRDFLIFDSWRLSVLTDSTTMERSDLKSLTALVANCLRHLSQ